jgi:hypothetical protein
MYQYSSFRMYQYSSFRMYQYSSFHTYVDCHVTKSKVQAGAVTARKRQLRIGSKRHKLIVKESGWLDRQKNKNARLMNARVFAALIRRNE